jgi:site-specific recombinase XerD
MAHGVKDLNLNPDFADFMAFITSERGLAANTRLAYEMDLGQYFEFCVRKAIDPLTVTLNELRFYLAHLRKIRLSPRTLA